MGKLSNRVALITGAARGQGRAHAVRMADEGADIILADICAPATRTDYPAATAEDLAETVRQVETRGRGGVWALLDVRDLDAVQGLARGVVGGPDRGDLKVASAGV